VSASVTGLLVSVSVADAVASVWFSSAVVTQATPSGQAHPDERSSAFPSTSPTPFLPAGTTATATVSVRNLIGRFRPSSSSWPSASTSTRTVAFRRV
jgi:hypothetical protein